MDFERAASGAGAKAPAEGKPLIVAFWGLIFKPKSGESSRYCE
jgi:hypothetical protein